MNAPKRTLPAGQFKARCLQLMDEVNEQGVEITITKRGQPVAKLAPITPAPLNPADLFGAMSGMAAAMGDVESSLEANWEADR